MSTQNISLEIDIKMVTRDCDKGDDTLASICVSVDGNIIISVEVSIRVMILT